MHEIETKVLEVDPKKITAKMETLKAKLIQNSRLAVDWYRTRNSKEGDDEWYLRIRTYSSGKSEVTWKGKSEVLGIGRKHKEINFTVADAKKMSDLFEMIGLEKYAHQEKDRKSWVLNDWQFDLDQYPGMPAYLEIEGKSEDHLLEAVRLLDLKQHETSSEGERKVISKNYNLDWYNMRF